MARGRGTQRPRRVTTYRISPRASRQPAARSSLPWIVGGVVVVGALAAALIMSGTLQTILGSGGTPAPSRPTALPAGTYQSRAFNPQLTFTLPAGWWVPSDSANFLELAPVDSDALGIYLFRDPRAASQDASCPLSPEPSVGTLSTDLSTWIRSRPGFVTSNPRLADVGGLYGVELDVGIAATWTASCPFANGAPTVPLFVYQPSELRWVVAGSERLRLSLLDVPGGGTVVVDIDAFDGSLTADFLSRATPIVQSFKFGGSGSTPAAPASPGRS